MLKCLLGGKEGSVLSPHGSVTVLGLPFLSLLFIFEPVMNQTFPFKTERKCSGALAGGRAAAPRPSVSRPLNCPPAASLFPAEKREFPFLFLPFHSCRFSFQRVTAGSSPNSPKSGVSATTREKVRGVTLGVKLPVAPDVRVNAAEGRNTPWQFGGTILHPDFHLAPSKPATVNR